MLFDFFYKDKRQNLKFSTKVRNCFEIFIQNVGGGRANASQLSLGQVKVDEKSNKITAIPKLLDVLAVKGCIVTIDAMGCQREIAAKIIEKEADYILAVKGNQGCLEADIEWTIRFTEPTSAWQEDDFDHGRIETRKCSVYRDLSLIDNASNWNGLQGLIKIESTRYIKSTGKEETDIRLYITSSKATAEVLGKGVRSHWGVENSLYWTLDVSFNEDSSRKRDGYAAQNFSLLNRIALNLIKKEQSKKRSVKGKKLDAGWNNEYLLKILTN